ncbi:MAG: 2-phospho-L-lactate transferase [Pseudomonadota bacterium]
MKQVTLLAGGVGGAKMAEGLAALDDVDLTVIGNVADDEQFHGLWVSPDIDTVTYTLAGMIDRSQGWGVADESHRAMDVLETLGEPVWMTLGDKDFGLHIYRTMRRARGDRPTQIAADAARAFGVKARILLPTDDPVQTRLETDRGGLSFQEYFVREKCEPTVSAVWFEWIERARPTPEALEAIDATDLVVIAPSNPLVSIDPILSVPGIHDHIVESGVPVIAVSPLIGGKAVKGPAAAMMEALGLEVSALGVARHYLGLVDHMMIDNKDAVLVDDIHHLGMHTTVTNTLMKDLGDKERVAREIMETAA